MLMLLSYQRGSLTRALLTTSPSRSFSLFIAPLLHRRRFALKREANPGRIAARAEFRVSEVPEAFRFATTSPRGFAEWLRRVAEISSCICKSHW